MHPNYKLDENILKDIISTNVKCTQLNIIFYITSIRKNLVIKNSPKSESETLDMVMLNKTLHVISCRVMQNTLVIPGIHLKMLI